MNGEATQGLFSALGHRPFALLWAGQATSRLGDNIYTVALAWWVLRETGSAAAMGGVLICSVAPVVALALAGGVAVDRLPRLPVMLTADIVRGLIAAVLAVAAAADVLDLWHVFLASAVFGFSQAFFQPAYTAVVPQISAPADLPSANSLTALSQQIGQVAGPAIGGICIAFGGSWLGFAVNAASFAVSTGTLAAIDWRAIPAVAGERGQGVLADARAGLAAVFREPWLWFTISLASLANLLLMGPMRIALPFLLIEERGESAWAYGLVLTMGAAGSIAVAVWLGRRPRLRRRGLIAYTALMANGLMLLIFAANGPLPAFWGAALVGGGALGLFELIWVGTLQEMVPGHLLGRVASVDFVGSFGLVPVGVALAGLSTGALGAREVLVIGGAGMVLMPLLGLLHPAIRRLD
ncbi:MAG: MFS transporter [Dehalococcoidia bacterium]